MSDSSHINLTIADNTTIMPIWHNARCKLIHSFYGRSSRFLNRDLVAVPRGSLASLFVEPTAEHTQLEHPELAT
jgi:hypothetical protein